MQTRPSPTRLFPHQTRVIHAAEGMRIQVVRGHLWITQPNDAHDLFLGPGDCIDLMSDWVVIGADALPRQSNDLMSGLSEYVLHPLVIGKTAPQHRSAWAASLAWLRGRNGGKLGAGLPAAPAV